MKTSLCITVLNEEKSIGPLLDSIICGTKKPDQIIIVDGGSTDRTLTVVNNLQLKINKQFPNLKFQLISKKGVTIAKGRNLAIKNATGNIIVQVDAGCIVKKNWFNKITQPFINKSIDVVAGYYEMPARGPIQSAMNVFHGVPPQRFDPNTYIPSARSVAFKKEVWEKIGGYNERLKGAGEDTLFFNMAVKKNFYIKRVGDAIVIWEETRNLTLTRAIKKFYNYAKGDALSGIWINSNPQIMSHNIKVVFVFLRYFIGLLFLWVGFYFSEFHSLLAILVIFYLIYTIYKWHDVVKNTNVRLWLVVIQILTDIAVMLGFASGILNVDGILKRHSKRP